MDENGRGIWIYLANWAEIQMATAYDSELGKAAADAALAGTTADLPSYVARLTLIGEAAQTTYLDISTPEALVNALQNGLMVRLQQDLTLTEPITLSDGIKTVLDMNGHTLTVPANSSGELAPPVCRIMIALRKCDRPTTFPLTAQGSLAPQLPSATIPFSSAVPCEGFGTEDTDDAMRLYL